MQGPDPNNFTLLRLTNIQKQEIWTRKGTTILQHLERKNKTRIPLRDAAMVRFLIKVSNLELEDRLQIPAP